MHQVGHTDPKLTLRIDTQVLKRRRSEEYRAPANELLGAAPRSADRASAAEAPDRARAAPGR